MANGTAWQIVTTRLAGMRPAGYTGRSMRHRGLLLVITLTGALVMIAAPQAGAQVKPLTVSSSSYSHRSPAVNPPARSATNVASTLSGVLNDSLGNAVAGATVGVFPPGTRCAQGAVASTTTAAGGSFSVSVSPGTYDVSVYHDGDSADPTFGICTEKVDLTTSVDDTLTVPVTQLTVTAENSDGDLLQGVKIPGTAATGGSLAAFDLFPGQPTDGSSYLVPDQAYTTGAAGTATIPLMPMNSPLTLAVDPPDGSDLAPTTISTGLMTTNTAVTATLAVPVTLSGVLNDSLGNAVAGATVGVFPPGTRCAQGAVASTTTAAGGSFSVSVSPGTYDVSVYHDGDSADPTFGICTEKVDLTTSVDDTLTVPVTQLTVTAENSDGDLLQGVKIPGTAATGGSLAAFDLFPGQPTDGSSYLVPDQAYTTGAAGTATIPLMPMNSPLTLAVDPPDGSDLAPTTISTGLMTTNTAVTATLAEKPGPPPPPTGVTAKPGNGSAIVSWTAPTLQSGSVTGYTATASPGDRSCTTTGATTCTITGLTNGSTYTVTVIAHTTAGDSRPSAPATVTPQAQKSATSTSITSTTASPVVGQPVTTTVQVAGQPTGAGDPTPTGTVTVSDGTRSCQAPLSGSNGVATGSCQITEQSPGSYSFTASYPGDASFAASTTSPPTTVRVGHATSATSITPSTASAVAGQPVTETVKVSGEFTGSGDPAPAGTVTVHAGAQSCQATLSGGNGVATGSCQITEPALGSYSLTATYPGDKAFDPSRSLAGRLTVSRARSHTTLHLSVGSAVYGNEKSLTMKVTVAPQFTGTPTGKVKITAGQITLCIVQLSGGTGTCSPASPTVVGAGTATLVAGYPGDLGFNSSAADATLTVRRATSRTTLTLSPASVKYGHEMSVKITVAVAPQFFGSPTGDVIITAGRATLCTVRLASTTHTCSLPSKRALSPGRHVLTASYRGSADFAPSSATNRLTVTRP